MEGRKPYKAALYLRVSKEDKDKKYQTETFFSNSIENQKRFLLEYLKYMPEVTVYDSYIDDGYSGILFEKRPGFLRMWKDIENGKVNMVVVKDLSRFGREHIETDTYIQKIFPSLGVRFLAVGDSYDSLYAKEGERNLLIPVKNFINDYYARDISMKIRSSQEAMRKAGIYAGAYAPYGYKKENGKLVLDCKSAKIVRLIFLKKLEGDSAGRIAKQLNTWGISSPAEYKRENGSAYYTGFQCYEIAKWSGMSVAKILKNRVYTGVLEQGKRTQISYKVKKVISLPEEKWSIVEGTHRAIISKQEFELVQRLSLLDMRKAPKQNGLYLFSGLLFCGDCKTMMTRRAGRLKEKKDGCYLCSAYNKGRGCTRHAIPEKLLFQIIESLLQRYTKQFEQIRQEICFQEKMSSEYRVIWQDLIENHQKNIEKCLLRLKQIEEDFHNHLLTYEEYEQYKKVYQTRRTELEKAILLCQKEQERKKSAEKNIKFIPDRLLVILLMERIEVYDGKHIKIRFAFRMDK